FSCQRNVVVVVAQQDLPLAGFAFGREIFLEMNLPQVARFLERLQHRVIEIRLGQRGKPACVAAAVVDEVSQPEGQLKIIGGNPGQRGEVDPVRRTRQQVNNGPAFLEKIDQTPRRGGGKLLHAREDQQLGAGEGKLVELGGREQHRSERADSFLVGNE